MNSDVEETRAKLLKGIRHFHTKVFPLKQEVYERVTREGQRPHTLFITCSDSRMNPSLLMQTEPGDVFSCQNIGNLVPPYPEMMGSISAVIESAVSALNVKMVVICGHHDCKAMDWLLHPEQLKDMPTVRAWLTNAERALGRLDNIPDDPSCSRQDELAKQSVLLQLEHLRKHPSVARRLKEGTLAVAGWFFDIENGKVLIYNPETNMFEDTAEGMHAALNCG